MDNPDKLGSYIVRDKRGTYMGAYSEKLGGGNAKAWAIDCAKQSRGVLYHRKAPELPEEEIASFLDYGKKNKNPRAKTK
jgi:hypothetical protein